MCIRDRVILLCGGASKQMSCCIQGCIIFGYFTKIEACSRKFIWHWIYLQALPGNMGASVAMAIMGFFKRNIGSIKWNGSGSVCSLFLLRHIHLMTFGYTMFYTYVCCSTQTFCQMIFLLWLPYIAVNNIYLKESLRVRILKFVKML